MADADSSSNPLLAEFDFPPFDRVEPVHVRPGIRALLARLEGEQEELEKGMEPAWERLVHPLERIFDRLNVVWNVVDHLKAVKDSADLCAAIKNVQPKKVKFYLRLGQSKPIYEAFNAIRNSSDLNSLSDARKRVVEGRQGPPSPSSSGYAGDRGSSVASSAGIEEPDPAPPLTPGAEDWARGKKHADEDDGSASWWKRKKHFFILSNSGKPIYSRYGDEHRLAGFSATCKRSFLLLRTVVIISNL